MTEVVYCLKLNFGFGTLAGFGSTHHIDTVISLCIVTAHSGIDFGISGEGQFTRAVECGGTIHITGKFIFTGQIDILGIHSDIFTDFRIGKGDIIVVGTVGNSDAIGVFGHDGARNGLAAECRVGIAIDNELHRFISFGIQSRGKGVESIDTQILIFCHFSTEFTGISGIHIECGHISVVDENVPIFGNGKFGFAIDGDGIFTVIKGVSGDIDHLADTVKAFSGIDGQGAGQLKGTGGNCTAAVDGHSAAVIHSKSTAHRNDALNSERGRHFAPGGGLTDPQSFVVGGTAAVGNGELAADVIQSVASALAVEIAVDSDVTAEGVIHVSGLKVGVQSINAVLEESVVGSDHAAVDDVFISGSGRGAEGEIVESKSLVLFNRDGSAVDSLESFDGVVSGETQILLCFHGAAHSGVGQCGTVFCQKRSGEGRDVQGIVLTGNGEGALCGIHGTGTERSVLKGDGSAVGEGGSPRQIQGGSVDIDGTFVGTVMFSGVIGVNGIDFGAVEDLNSSFVAEHS